MGQRRSGRAGAAGAKKHSSREKKLEKMDVNAPSWTRRDILPWRRAIRPPGAHERLRIFVRPAGKNRAPRRGDRARRDSGGVPPESALRDFFLGLQRAPLLGISASLTCSPGTCARGDDGLATRKMHKSRAGWNDGSETPGSARERRDVALARPSPALFKTETMTLFFSRVSSRRTRERRARNARGSRTSRALTRTALAMWAGPRV